jgi:hypothetical protein
MSEISNEEAAKFLSLKGMSKVEDMDDLHGNQTSWETMYWLLLNMHTNIRMGDVVWEWWYDSGGILLVDTFMNDNMVAVMLQLSSLLLFMMEQRIQTLEC